MKSFVRRQLCKSPFYGYREYPLEPGSHMSCCRATLLEQHECSTAVDLLYSVRCWIDGLQHYVWRSKVRPHDPDSALLETPLERMFVERPCLCSAQNPNMLVSISVLRAVQAVCAERSTSTNYDGDGDGQEKSRTADGVTFVRLCVRRRSKVWRAQLEKILDVQRRSDTTFPIRAVHSTCMHSNATSASAQLACSMTVQHGQVWWEMRWPRPSHDSWPRRS